MKTKPRKILSFFFRLVFALFLAGGLFFPTTLARYGIDERLRWIIVVSALILTTIFDETSPRFKKIFLPILVLLLLLMFFVPIR